MSTYVPRPSSKLLMGLALLLALGSNACQQQPATSNSSTTNITNSGSINAPTPSSTSTTTSPMGTTIETREPDKYSATVTLKVEVTGTQSISTPPLSADFARDGANRRVAMKLPGGDQVIYLDRGDKRYIVLPNRKQYAEIDAKSTGFEVPTIMTPEQIVNQAKSIKGCESAGEETFGGRSAMKYRCSGSAKTGTKAGEVTAESFLYVDKETNLPLRTESVVSSSTNVGGASAVKIVTEMGNIQGNVPATVFDEPTGMNKVDPAQVRSQVEAVLKAALFFMQNMMGSNSAPAASPSPSK